MQIATSGFHTYNHNLITEARILFWSKGDLCNQP